MKLAGFAFPPPFIFIFGFHFIFFILIFLLALRSCSGLLNCLEFGYGIYCAYRYYIKVSIVNSSFTNNHGQVWVYAVPTEPIQKGSQKQNQHAYCK